MKEYKGEVWQDGFRVAMAQGRDYAKVNAETAHYAAMYSQDGPVDLKYFEKARKVWKLVGYLPHG